MIFVPAHTKTLHVCGRGPQNQGWQCPVQLQGGTQRCHGAELPTYPNGVPGRAELDCTPARDLVISSEVTWSYSYPTREATTPWLHLSICLSPFPLGSAGKKPLGVPHGGEGTGPGAQPALGGEQGLHFAGEAAWGDSQTPPVFPGIARGKKSQQEHRHGQLGWDCSWTHRWRLGCWVSQEGLGPGRSLQASYRDLGTVEVSPGTPHTALSSPCRLQACEGRAPPGGCPRTMGTGTPPAPGSPQKKEGLPENQPTKFYCPEKWHQNNDLLLLVWRVVGG